ncbi:hypothetical protein ACQUXI_003940 [Cronobacter turicensis]|nr:hypothetical protein [Klebsiella pneumoniae]
MGILLIVMLSAGFMFMLRSGFFARIHSVLSRMGMTGLFYPGLALLTFRFAVEMVFSSLDGMTDNMAGNDAMLDGFCTIVAAAGVLLIMLSFIVGAINRFRTGKTR